MGLPHPQVAAIQIVGGVLKAKVVDALLSNHRHPRADDGVDLFLLERLFVLEGARALVVGVVVAQRGGVGLTGEKVELPEQDHVVHIALEQTGSGAAELLTGGRNAVVVGGVARYQVGKGRLGHGASQDGVVGAPGSKVVFKRSVALGVIVGDEEVSLVAHDRSTGRQTPVLPLELIGRGVLGAGIIELVQGGGGYVLRQSLVGKEVEGAAVVVVGAGFGDDVDEPTAVETVLRLRSRSG